MSALFTNRGLAGLLADPPPPNRLAGLINTPPPPNSLSLLASLLNEEPRTYPSFEVYPDKRGEWRWRLKANNYKIIADGAEGYKNYADAVHGIELVQSCFNAPVYRGKE